MALSSDVAVNPAAKGTLMPDNYTQCLIFLNAEVRRKLAAIRAYLKTAVAAPDELYARYSLDNKYARSKEFEFNVSALADACGRKLLYDLEHDLVDVTALKVIVEGYYQSERDTRFAIALNDNAVAELEQIVDLLQALDIEVKPISRRGIKNRKLPLNVAIAYCYRFVEQKQAN